MTSTSATGVGYDPYVPMYGDPYPVLRRLRSERGVLDAYLDELDRDVDAERAWTWYRASALYGVGVQLSTLGTDGYQSREVPEALARRYAAATVELDAVAALEELESRRAGVQP